MTSGWSQSFQPSWETPEGLGAWLTRLLAPPTVLVVGPCFGQLPPARPEDGFALELAPSFELEIRELVPYLKAHQRPGRAFLHCLELSLQVESQDLELLLSNRYGTPETWDWDLSPESPGAPPLEIP